MIKTWKFGILVVLLLGLSLACVYPVMAQTEIEFYHGFQTGRMHEAMNEMVKYFEETHPDIKVKQVLVAWDKMLEKTITAVAGGNPPDVFRGWQFLIPDWAEQEALTPLDEFIERDKEEWKPEDFFEVTMDQATYKGKVWGVSPSTICDSVMFWNKDRFMEVGLDPERFPQSIAELDEYAERLTEKSGDTLTRIGFIPWLAAGHSVLWEPPLAWPYAWHGQKPWDPEEEKVNIYNDAYIEVFKWFDQYAQKFGREAITEFVSASSSGNFGRWNPQGPLYTGKLAMWISGQWLYNDIKEFAPEMNFGMTGLISKSPQEGVSNTSMVVSNFFFMPKGAKHPDAAWEFLKFVSGPYYMNNFVLLDSVTPSRKSVAYSTEFEEKAPWVKITREIMERGLSSPNMPGLVKFQDELDAAIDYVVTGQKSPEEALSDVQKIVQAEVDRKIKKK